MEIVVQVSVRKPVGWLALARHGQFEARMGGRSPCGSVTGLQVLQEPVGRGPGRGPVELADHFLDISRVCG
jgi:hypothetical protein